MCAIATAIAEIGSQRRFGRRMPHHPGSSGGPRRGRAQPIGRRPDAGSARGRAVRPSTRLCAGRLCPGWPALAAAHPDNVDYLGSLIWSIHILTARYSQTAQPGKGAGLRDKAIRAAERLEAAAASEAIRNGAAANLGNISGHLPPGDEAVRVAEKATAMFRALAGSDSTWEAVPALHTGARQSYQPRGQDGTRLAVSQQRGRLRRGCAQPHTRHRGRHDLARTHDAGPPALGPGVPTTSWTRPGGGKDGSLPATSRGTRRHGSSCSGMESFGPSGVSVLPSSS